MPKVNSSRAELEAADHGQQRAHGDARHEEAEAAREDGAAPPSRDEGDAGAGGFTQGLAALGGRAPRPAASRPAWPG
jgi:hypothetical protein